MESQAVDEQPTYSTCGINSRLLNEFTNFTNRHQNPSLLPWTSKMKRKINIENKLDKQFLDPRSQRAGSYKFGAVIVNV